MDYTHLLSSSHIFLPIPFLELWMENFGGPIEGTEKFKGKSYEIEKLLAERFPTNPRPDGAALDEAEATQKLCFATRRGFLPMVRNLVAAWKGNTKIVNDWPIQPESRMPASALFLAAQEGHIDIVRILLQNGADVNSIDENTGVNALLIATQQKRFDIMKLLLEAGAIPTRSEEQFNLSPLYISCQNGFLEGAKLLLDHGANLHFTYNNGVSVLFIGKWIPSPFSLLPSFSFLLSPFLSICFNLSYQSL
jgi:hypothetical protein